MRRRVRSVYLAWANPVFLAFFSFNRINNLRVFSVAFSSIPTAPTNQLILQDLKFPFLAKLSFLTIGPNSPVLTSDSELHFAARHRRRDRRFPV
jgi:hypothetical protein